ncbi:hypothetical protein MCRY_09330 [Marivita cryptomonadis]|nr:hypothetical protein MCRY_09330 [Marivita cryptomonadis]
MGFRNPVAPRFARRSPRTKKTVVPREERHHRFQFTASREEERTPILCGHQPEICDGDTREEERCHRRVHGIQGGGEDAEPVWALARNL